MAGPVQSKKLQEGPGHRLLPLCGAPKSKSWLPANLQFFFNWRNESTGVLLCKAAHLRSQLYFLSEGAITVTPLEPTDQSASIQQPSRGAQRRLQDKDRTPAKLQSQPLEERGAGERWREGDTEVTVGCNTVREEVK